MSLPVGPDVDRIAIANQLEHARLGELLGGPLVQGLQPWNDHRVVEHPAQALLVGDVALDVMVEWIAVREHTSEREERSRHPEPRIAQEAAERSNPPQRQSRRRDQ